jgi:hypothetical protein
MLVGVRLMCVIQSSLVWQSWKRGRRLETIRRECWGEGSWGAWNGKFDFWSEDFGNWRARSLVGILKNSLESNDKQGDKTASSFTFSSLNSRHSNLHKSPNHLNGYKTAFKSTPTAINSLNSFQFLFPLNLDHFAFEVTTLHEHWRH